MNPTETIQRLSAMADIDKKAASISEFRADFKRAFAIWRDRGEISEVEARAQIAEAGAAVQNNMHDAEWMECAAKYFRLIVDQHEGDKARSARIADEVRANRTAKEKRTSA